MRSCSPRGFNRRFSVLTSGHGHVKVPYFFPWSSLSTMVGATQSGNSLFHSNVAPVHAGARGDGIFQTILKCNNGWCVVCKRPCSQGGFVRQHNGGKRRAQCGRHADLYRLVGMSRDGSREHMQPNFVDHKGGLCKPRSSRTWIQLHRVAPRRSLQLLRLLIWRICAVILCAIGVRYRAENSVWVIATKGPIWNLHHLRTPL